MSRDYKKIRYNPSRERAFVTGNLLSFLSGLSLGLLVAFIVFLRCQLEEPDAPREVAGPAGDIQTQTGKQKPDLKFTFYDTLRNKKVNISEWVAGDRDSPEDDAGEKTVETRGQDESQVSDDNQEQFAARQPDVKDDVYGYVLQVGSFKEFSSADKIKAELALLGIFANIQRVMLNGQDVRHRVRLGPYKSMDEMKDISRRLDDNQIEFMLLELREGQDTT